MVEGLSKGRRGEFNLGVGVTQKWQQRVKYIVVI